MCEEMALTHLQQTLRSLCFKSEWKYAVFWKLKHRARMMLTWEDAYYANNKSIDRPDQMSTNEDALDDLHDRHYLHDPLGLAVAKMSYLVYSLGEGIIGQVAVTGKHQWIYADKLKSYCCSSSEYCDGWQSQFSAGIKTIAVVAVVPHGVVQLGSLHSVTEDMKLVTHIKDVFCSLQNSSTKIFPYPLPDTTQSSSYLSEVSAKISGADVLNDYSLSSDNIALSNRKIDVQSYSSSSPKIFHGLPQDVLALHNQKKTVEMVSDVAQMSTFMRDHDSIDFLQTKSVIFNSQQHKQAHRELNKKVKCEEGMGGWRNMVVQSRDSGVSVAYNYSGKSPNSDRSMLPRENSANSPFLPSSILCSDVGVDYKFDRVGCLQDEEVPSMKPFEMQMTGSEVSCTDTVNNSLKFSAGCELYEALGPAFSVQQDNSSWSESERTEAEKVLPLEGMVSSLFTTECGSDYLLEAVVIKSSTLSSNSKSESAFSKSAESVLTTGKTSETSNCIKHSNVIASGSVGHSAPWLENAHEKVKMIWDSAEVCNLRLSKELSSKTMSTSSKQSEIQIEQTKVNRKRARPGESCRPRPRDRQLIQDRVKELRELVPNGSKCSIDSLLERTIKHMFFLQNVTKHADKLRKCAESKFRDKKMSLLGSCSHEHGSSWALDVGGQAEICPLVVENLNIDGQMLVEMLCEESCHFLEIAEAIRTLGLKILKGVTEARGESLWACFVVEGQNNRDMHRMDILWSLMQLLQPRLQSDRYVS